MFELIKCVSAMQCVGARMLEAAVAARDDGPQSAAAAQVAAQGDGAEAAVAASVTLCSSGTGIRARIHVAIRPQPLWS